MDTDIRDELDRAFGEGPPIDDLDLLLDRGRAAVRRRRLAGAASMALAAGVVVGVALVSTGGSTTSTPPGPAVGPSTTATHPVVPDAIQPDVVPIIWDDRLADGLHSLNPPPVSYESDGFVHVQPGVEILDTIAAPYGNDSAAVEFRIDGTTHWFAGALASDGNHLSKSTPARPGLTFEEWVERSGMFRVEVVCEDGTPAGVPVTCDVTASDAER